MVPRLIARLALVVPFAAAMLSVACEHAGPTGPTLGALAILVVTPNPNALAVGGTQQFVASGKDANGNVVTLSPVPTWSVVAGGGAISTSGLFTAGSLAGLFANTVQATSGTVSGFATVSVTAGGLATITVAPTPVSVGTNATVQFTAVGRDANGNIIPIPAPLTWSVQTAAAGTIVAASGLFTASAAVATYANAVRATSGSIFGNATVTVVAPGALAAIIVTPNPATVATAGTLQFSAAGQDATGAFVTIPPGLTWSVVNGGGSIVGATGVLTAGGVAGSFSNTVRATSGSISGFASVTVTSAASVGPSLGTAAAFAVLGSTAVSCIGVSNIAGSVGVAPAGSVSGFPAPCVIASPGDPVPHVNDAVATVAQADVTPAYLALAAMPCGTVLTGQDLGGMTLAPGVYCFTSSAQLTGNLTLAGPANGLWVFQVASALTTGTSAQVILSGGAVAKNVFWQIGSSATLGQTTIFRGNIIAAVSITMVQGSTLFGRALSKAGVTMDGSTITLP
jgi:hypothetical protein